MGRSWAWRRKVGLSARRKPALLGRKRQAKQRRSKGEAKELVGVRAIPEASGMSRLRETGRDPDHFSSTSRGLGNAKLLQALAEASGMHSGLTEDRWRQMLKTSFVVLNLFSDILLSDRQMKSL